MNAMKKVFTLFSILILPTSSWAVDRTSQFRFIGFQPLINAGGGILYAPGSNALCRYDVNVDTNQVAQPVCYQIPVSQPQINMLANASINKNGQMAFVGYTTWEDFKVYFWDPISNPQSQPTVVPGVGGQWLNSSVPVMNSSGDIAIVSQDESNLPAVYAGNRNGVLEKRFHFPIQERQISSQYIDINEGGQIAYITNPSVGLSPAPPSTVYVDSSPRATIPNGGGISGISDAGNVLSYGGVNDLYENQAIVAHAGSEFNRETQIASTSQSGDVILAEISVNNGRGIYLEPQNVPLLVPGDTIGGRTVQIVQIEGRHNVWVMGRAIAADGSFVVRVIFSDFSEGYFLSNIGMQSIPEFHIGQVVEDPRCATCGSPAGVIDLVDQKAAFAVLRISNFDGSPSSNKVVHNISVYFQSGERTSIPSMVTDSSGSLLIPITPSIRKMRSSSGKLVIEFDDPATSYHRVLFKSVSIWKTRDLRFGYAYVSGCKSGTRSTSCYSSPSSNFDFNKDIANSNLFMQATFPVAESGISFAALPSFLGQPDTRGAPAGFCQDKVTIKQLADDSSRLTGKRIAKSVMIVPAHTETNEGYIQYHFPSSGAGGMAAFGGDTSVVQESEWTTVAHEISHAFCVRYDGKFGCRSLFPINPVYGHTLCRFDGSGNPIMDDTPCDPVYSGYNAENSTLLDPVGAVSSKYPLLGATRSLHEEGIKDTWIDPTNYSQLFGALVLAARDEPTSTKTGMRLIATLDPSGRPTLVSATQVLYDPSEVNLNSPSEISVQGFSNSGATILSDFLRFSESNSLDGQRPRTDAGCQSFLEWILDFGYTLKTVVLGGARGASLVIVPSVSILRTEISRLPDSAFSGNAEAQRAAILGDLGQVESKFLSGDMTGTSASIYGLLSIVEKSISGGYVPSQGIGPTLISLKSDIVDLAVRTVGGGQTSGTKSNSFLTITEMKPAPVAGKRAFVGSIGSAPSGGSELLVRVKSGGSTKKISVHDDNSLGVSLDDISGNIRFFVVLRNKNQAHRIEGEIRDVEEELVALRKRQSEEIDPIERQRLQGEISAVESEVHNLTKKLSQLESQVGDELSF